jgi:hypothetical protein
MNPIKKPALSDGTGVNLRTLIAYVKQATVALEQSGQEDAAHYFDCFHDYLTKDVTNGKPFGFTYKSLGL